MYQIPIGTVILRVRPFLIEIYFLFLITVIWKRKRTERGGKKERTVNENITADPFAIREWDQNPDQIPPLLSAKSGQNCLLF